MDSLAQRIRVAGGDVAWLASLVGAVAAMAAIVPNEAAQRAVLWSLGLAVAAAGAAAALIPVFAAMTLKRGGLGGKDMGKRHDPTRADILV